MTFSNALQYRMMAGIPGTPNRLEHCVIEPQQYDLVTPPTVFGVPIKYVSGKVQPIASADVIANVVMGFLVRPFPIAGLVPSEPILQATPDKYQIANVMKRGYLHVVVQGSLPSAVPAKEGIVYCRKTDHGDGSLPIGGVESDADGGKCEAVPYAYFTGAMDSNGLCEIRYKI